jgi:hypothetical protein
VSGRRRHARRRHASGLAAQANEKSWSSAVAGAAPAKYLAARFHLDVTLLEPNKEFISCPFSNLVIVENLKTLTRLQRPA